MPRLLLPCQGEWRPCSGTWRYLSEPYLSSRKKKKVLEMGRELTSGELEKHKLPKTVQTHGTLCAFLSFWREKGGILMM